MFEDLKKATGLKSSRFELTPTTEEETARAKDSSDATSLESKPEMRKWPNQIVAQIRVLTKEEGGRHTPFFDGYKARLHYRDKEVTSIIHMPEGWEIVMPGDVLNPPIELLEEIPIESGEQFEIRDNGRIVATGVVIEATQNIIAASESATCQEPSTEAGSSGSTITTMKVEEFLRTSPDDLDDDDFAAFLERLLAIDPNSLPANCQDDYREQVLLSIDPESLSIKQLHEQYSPALMWIRAEDIRESLIPAFKARHQACIDRYSEIVEAGKSSSSS